MSYSARTMPEGDTIHTLARELGRELDGQALAGLVVRNHGERRELVGATLGPVEARGKHLLVPIGDRVVLRVHLGMYGGWDRFAVRGDAQDPRAGWRRRTRGHEVVVRTDRVAFACRKPMAAELLRTDRLATHPVLSRLGPDLLVPGVDWDRILERARARAGEHAELRLRELLLDQTVASGIGNIFKNEALFTEGLHPDTDVCSLDDGALLGLYRRAARLMRANVAAVPRILTAVQPGARFEQARRDAQGGDSLTWVYGRGGRPCRRCGTPIRFADEGGDDRITWWCPSCQRRPGLPVTGPRSAAQDE